MVSIAHPPGFPCEKCRDHLCIISRAIFSLEYCKLQGESHQKGNSQLRNNVHARGDLISLHGDCREKKADPGEELNQECRSKK